MKKLNIFKSCLKARNVNSSFIFEVESIMPIVRIKVSTAGFLYLLQFVGWEPFFFVSSQSVIWLFSYDDTLHKIGSLQAS